MYKISIIKDGQITNQASFSTQEEGAAWLSTHEGQGNFGQKASSSSQQVEISPAVLDEDGVEIVPAQYELQIIEIPGYSVEILDISAEIEQEKANSAALQYLSDTDWLIIREVDEGTPCPAEIKQARAEARASIVR